MARNNDFKLKLVALAIIVAVILGIVALVSLWTQSNLDFWISHFKGTAVHIPYWMSFILTLVANGLAVLGNIIASIARFVI